MMDWSNGIKYTTTVFAAYKRSLGKACVAPTALYSILNSLLFLSAYAINGSPHLQKVFWFSGYYSTNVLIIFSNLVFIHSPMFINKKLNIILSYIHLYCNANF